MRKLLRSIRQFLSELKRRNVYQVALAYLAAGFVVVELANIAAGAFDLPGWFEPMVWVVVGLGFPIALVLAWALEVTPEGVRVEEPEGAGEDAESPDGFSPSNGVIAGLLIVAIGLLLYPRLFSSGEEASGQASSAKADTMQVEERSVAVLPFTNLSGGEETRPVARGLHDDLLTRLSNVADLQVISRTSVEHYRDTDLPLPAIADSLGVRWIVEGGVQQAGKQIQVNAQLIDPRTDAHRWANSYQRDLSAEDLFAIQGEIAQEITGALKAKLTAGEQDRLTGAPTENLDAYRLYVQGRRELAQRRFSSSEPIERAARYFQRAIAQDSSFALAWAGLADAIGFGFDPGSAADSFRVPPVTQEEAARRALQLDPDLAEAHSALGLAYLEAHNAPAALREARRAIELKPSYAEAHQLLGTVLQVIGRFEEALRHFQVAEKLNPRHLLARHALFDALMWAGKHKKALVEVRQQQEMADYVPAIWAEIRALTGLGRYEEAIAMAKQRLRKTENAVERVILHKHLVGVEAESRDTTEARRHLRSMQQVSLRREQRRAISWEFMFAHANVGNFDAAFQEVRLEDWESVVPHIVLRKGDSPMRQDPRWDELMRRLNRHWGLNPDGSLPEEADISFDAEADA